MAPFGCPPWPSTELRLGPRFCSFSGRFYILTLKNPKHHSCSSSKSEKKIAYDSKLCQLKKREQEYNQILIVAADNVGSKLQSIRKGLRGDSVVLMGKNTMMKRSIRIQAENTCNNAFPNLIPLLVVSFVLLLSLFQFLFVSFIVKNCVLFGFFTEGDLKEVSEEVTKYKVSLENH